MRFSGILAAAALGGIVSLAALAAPAAGKDYTLISPAEPTSDASRIVVTEFFSYQCPHCYRFAPAFSAWAKTLPADVKVERVAVSIGHEAWEPAAQAFYALTAMNKVAAVDDAFFRAIHEQREKLFDERSISEWVARQGINREEFSKYYRSFSVGVKSRYADEMSRRHRIPGVPALVIDGRYLISISDDGRFDDQLEIANELIDKARRERPRT